MTSNLVHGVIVCQGVGKTGWENQVRMAFEPEEE